MLFIISYYQKLKPKTKETSSLLNIFSLTNNKHYRIDNPIIFIGTGRSGTTIISEAILRHPDLGYPSNYQEWFYKFPAINLIRLLFDNKIWKIIGQKKQLNKVSIFNKYHFKPVEGYKMWNYLSGKNIDFSRGFLTEEKLQEQRVDHIRSYFSQMLRYQQRKRLALKITGPPRISYLVQIFPNATFINLKRNKIATISSFLKIDFWNSRGATKLWWQGVYSNEEVQWAEKNKSNPALLTAFQINKIDEITLMEVSRNKPKYIEISYEEFVKNPIKVIDEILAFSGLDPIDPKILLNNVKIYNRNKKDEEYFSLELLNEINSLLK